MYAAHIDVISNVCFVCVDDLHPSQQFFSHLRMFPGLN